MAAVPSTAKLTCDQFSSAQVQELDQRNPLLLQRPSFLRAGDDHIVLAAQHQHFKTRNEHRAHCSDASLRLIIAHQSSAQTANLYGYIITSACQPT